MFCAIAVEANSKLLKAKSRFVFIIYFCFVFIIWLQRQCKPNAIEPVLANKKTLLAVCFILCR